ncbi:hypothetical protein [Natrinema gelatinilyticum]|uniref:hypothetical protein n=1 Tax=Natrinema gelatinilyticum TaxID=2961571 RepID=UPI0020C247A1|nr:hypothetical protein [Natrinema gelatinilyticum]
MPNSHRNQSKSTLPAPDGTVIEAHATRDGELTPTLTTAVVSFGTTADGSRPKTTAPTLEDAYAAIVGMPVSATTDVAIDLVE